MRLKLSQPRISSHTEPVCGIGWTTSDEIVTASDDHNILKWTVATMDSSLITQLSQ